MFSFSKVRVVKCVSRVNPEYIGYFKPNQTKNKTYYSLNRPNCKHCKYYIKNESSEQLSKCKKFGQILDLIPLSEKVTKLTSLCSICKNGTPGIFSKRITTETEQTVVGSDNYIPVCRKCYHALNTNKPQ